MMILFKNNHILAIALPSLRISPLLIIRIAAIVLLYAVAVLFTVIYIQSIGSGIGIFSGLFHVTLISQSLETFFYVVGALILMPWSLSNAPQIKEYPLIILFTVLGGSLLLSSADLVSMYLSIELQSFAVYVLASIYKDSESATSAGLKYFLLGGLSSCLILLGCGLIYTYTGLTNLESIYTLISVSEGHNLVQGIVLGLVLTGVGFLFKVAAAPFHNWAPDVYNDVPTIVTTWLTVMPKITILIFLLDLQSGSIIASLPVIEASMPAFITDVSAAHNSAFYVFKNLLLICSVLSLIIGTVVGLAQHKIKRLFAYSTISHVGFLLLSMAINTEQSLESFLFYLVQYSLTNVNTFFILLAFGYVLFGAKAQDKNKSNTVNSQNISDIELISDLKGQFFNQPILSLSFAICLFSMAGVPPLLGFFGKQSVLYASMSTGYYFLSLVAIVVSVISASYYLRIIRVVFFDASTNSTTTNSTVATESTIANKVLANAELMNKSIIQNSHSFVIAILTLSIVLFFIKPTLVLNSIQLLALSMYNI